MRYLTMFFLPSLMKRYITVPAAAINTTKMLAFRVTPLAVSGKIVIG
jgi:hypothetical protein